MISYVEEYFDRGMDAIVNGIKWLCENMRNTHMICHDSGEDSHDSTDSDMTSDTISSTDSCAISDTDSDTANSVSDYLNGIEGDVSGDIDSSSSNDMTANSKWELDDIRTYRKVIKDYMNKKCGLFNDNVRIISKSIRIKDKIRPSTIRIVRIRSKTVKRHPDQYSNDGYNSDSDMFGKLGRVLAGKKRGDEKYYGNYFN